MKASKVIPLQAQQEHARAAYCQKLSGSWREAYRSEESTAAARRVLAAEVMAVTERAMSRRGLAASYRQGHHSPSFRHVDRWLHRTALFGGYF